MTRRSGQRLLDRMFQSSLLSLVFFPRDRAFDSAGFKLKPLLFQSLQQRRSQWGGRDALWLLTVIVSPLKRQHRGADARWRKPMHGRVSVGRQFRNKPDCLVQSLLTEADCGSLTSVTERRHFVSRPSDLVQGTLDMLILKILALEPLNGWAMSQRLKQISSEVLGVSDGSLYPALHKLEHRGWIRAQWKSSENNRRAKLYSLTPLGRKQLEKETANWNRISAAISGIVQLREV